MISIKTKNYVNCPTIFSGPKELEIIKRMKENMSARVMEKAGRRGIIKMFGFSKNGKTKMCTGLILLIVPRYLGYLHNKLQ